MFFDKVVNVICIMQRKAAFKKFKIVLYAGRMKVMRFNKKILMITTTAMVAVGSIGLMAAMKHENVKTEASDIKENDVAKAGVDVSSASMEGETPSEGERKMKKEVVEKYSYKGYEISFIRYKDAKTGEYLSDVEQSGDYGYKKTFREIIDNSEKRDWDDTIEALKGKKNKITAEIDWRRDNSKIVNNKFYGNLMRMCHIKFIAPNIVEDEKEIREVIGGFSTVAESGEYICGGIPESTELLEYATQWKVASKNKLNEIEEKLKKVRVLSKNKKERNKYVKEVKHKLIKEWKEVYGISFDKENEIFKDFESGIIFVYGKTEDGRKIEAVYDLAGEYISYWSYMN